MLVMLVAGDICAKYIRAIPGDAPAKTAGVGIAAINAVRKARMLVVLACRALCYTVTKYIRAIPGDALAIIAGASIAAVDGGRKALVFVMLGGRDLICAKDIRAIPGDAYWSKAWAGIAAIYSV